MNSHNVDLNTPNNGGLGYADLAQHHTSPQSTIQQGVQPPHKSKGKMNLDAAQLDGKDFSPLSAHVGTTSGTVHQGT